MAKNHRIFVSFAIEDVRYRDLLVGQAHNARTPFEFIDMSVKNPWDDSWKERCRVRIRGCDGMIALISANTCNASGALWEIQCAKTEALPLLGVYCTSENRPTAVPEALRNARIVNWTWPNLAAFIERL